MYFPCTKFKFFSPPNKGPQCESRHSTLHVEIKFKYMETTKCRIHFMVSRVRGFGHSFVNIHIPFETGCRSTKGEPDGLHGANQ